MWAPIDCCDSPKADNRRRGHVLVRLSMSSDPTGSDLWLSAQIVEHRYQREQASVQVVVRQSRQRAVPPPARLGKLQRQHLLPRQE